MDSARARTAAIELAKAALSAARPDYYPTQKTAEDLSAFITTLAETLEKMDP